MAAEKPTAEADSGLIAAAGSGTLVSILI